MSAGRAPRFGNKAGYEFFYWTARLFGLRVAYAFLWLVVPYYLLFRPSARRAAAPYLRSRFPNDAPLQRFLRSGRYFYAFAQCLIDQAAGDFVERQNIDTDFPLWEKALALFESPRGLVVLLSHAGPWQAAIGRMGVYADRVHYYFQKNGGPENALYFNLVGHDARTRIISPDDFLGGAVALTQILEQGGRVAMMGDRAWGGKTREVLFFGEKTAFPIFPHHLAAATGSAELMLLPVRTAPGRFRLEAVDLTAGLDLAATPREEAVAILMARYVAALEDFLRRYPYQWFHFRELR